MLLKWEAAHEKALNAARRRDVEKLLREETEFDNFIAALGKINGSDDPMPYLKSANTEVGNLIRDIYVIEVESWQAFFYADVVRKICVGLLVCQSDAYFDHKVQMIADAVGRHR